ncbi:MAG: alpha/beta hydrolase [Anaerorhabdus sp.]|uniref:alpha/beta hydrolase n=1 Tax=Anaerorhabdus sp. TaxID=1872524 RepID=UPI002FCC6ED0
MRIDEKIMVPINDLDQGMFIQTEDISKPVLLFLHGGPGQPMIAMCEKFPTGLDKLFTVCWWEQRGSGISYDSKMNKNLINVQQLIDDTLAVTVYLRKRFKKDKIYLMGHSWGSVLGILTVQQNPFVFEAYMGIGQVTNQDLSERLGYEYMCTAFEKLDDKKNLRKLKKYELVEGKPIPNSYLMTRTKSMTKLGVGVMHNKISMFEISKIILGTKRYTMVEKVKYLKGMKLSMDILFDEVTNKDYMIAVPKLEIPVYIFQGKYDYQVSYQLAKKYAKKIHAPLVGFYTFLESAHSPCFEEPSKMIRIIETDVLNKQTTLADSI